MLVKDFRSVMQSLLFFSLFCLLGCNYSDVKGSISDQALGDLTACGPIDYASIHKKIFLSRCVSCHNSNDAAKGVVLDSFAAVKANLVLVQQQVELNRMPTGKPLDIEEKKYLFAWINQGAPETTAEPAVQACNDPSITNPPGTSPPAISVPEIEPSYSSIKKNIFDFQRTCTLCHDQRAPLGKAKYDFSTFKTTISYTSLFDLKNPRESRFVKTLIRGEMPPFGDALGKEEIDIIIEWIRRGLPEEMDGPPGLVDLPNNTLPPAPILPPPPVAPVPPTANATACSDLVDFKDVDSQILQPVCLRCHGFATLPEFSDFANVRQHLVRLEQTVRLDRMPPRKPLDPDLKSLLFKWIQNGSPEKVDKTGCVP